MLVTTACVIVSVLSCTLFAPKFSIISWSPNSARVIDPASTYIWIEFSDEPDKDSAERAFSLTEDGASVQGRFSWSGNTMHFEPIGGIKENRTYAMTVTTVAERSDAISLMDEFYFEFSTKDEEDRPAIVSVTPADGAVITDRYASIVVTLSEPVDRASFYKAFSLSPSVKGAFEWSDGDSVCAFVPRQPYEWQVEYSLTIQNTLADLSGNLVTEPWKARFRIGDDTIHPTVVRVSNAVDGIEGAVILVPADPDDDPQVFVQGWESTWGIIIAFSEPVLREGMEGNISFEPAWSYTIDNADSLDDTFLLHPSERLARDTLYTLTIRDGIEDGQGNSMEAVTTYKFLVNGPMTVSPSVTRLRFRTNPSAAPSGAVYDDKTCDHSEDYTNISITSVEFGVGSAVETYVDVYFSLAQGAAIDRFSLMDNFSVSGTNSCASFSLKRIEIASFSEPQPLDIPGTACARIYFDIENENESGIVTFELDDGFVDSAGNPIDGSWRLPLLK
jgi:hypothetical protein